MMLADLIVAITTGIVTFTSQQRSLHEQVVSRARDGAQILGVAAAAILVAPDTTEKTATDLLQNLVVDGAETPGITYAAVFNLGNCAVASTVPQQVPPPHYCVQQSDLIGTHVKSNGDVQSFYQIVHGNVPLGYAVVIASNASAASDLRKDTLASIAIRAVG